MGDNGAKLFNPSKNTKGPNLTQRKVLLQLAQLCDETMRTQGYVLPSTTPRPPPLERKSAPKCFNQGSNVKNVFGYLSPQRDLYRTSSSPPLLYLSIPRLWTTMADETTYGQATHKHVLLARVVREVWILTT